MMLQFTAVAGLLAASGAALGAVVGQCGDRWEDRGCRIGPGSAEREHCRHQRPDDRGEPALLVADRLDVGAVNVNDVFSNLFAVGLPHSGWKSSGLGARLGGAQGLRKYCRVQAITEPRIQLTTKELTWYPYSARRTAIAGKVLRAAAGRGLRQRLGLNKENSK